MVISCRIWSFRFWNGFNSGFVSCSGFFFQNVFIRKSTLISKSLWNFNILIRGMRTIFSEYLIMLFIFLLYSLSVATFGLSNKLYFLDYTRNVDMKNLRVHNLRLIISINLKRKFWQRFFHVFVKLVFIQENWLNSSWILIL